MYKVLGTDGKEYGPVSFEQLKQWVAEGRVNAQTHVQQTGSTEWKSAGEFPEINALFAPPEAPGAGSALSTPPPIAPLPPLKQEQKGLAIASFVLGLAAFVLCLGVLAGIPAIILGHIAKARASRSPERYGGAGFAVAGLIIGYLSVAYTVLIIAMLVPTFVSAKGRAQTIMCSSQMRQIGLGLTIWADDHQGQFPFNVSTNAGGTKEFVARDNDGFDKHPELHFAALATELGSTKVLVCPLDMSKSPAPDFEHLTSQNVSYRLHVTPEVNTTNRTAVLATCPVHGNVLLCDGSVETKRRHRRLGRQ
jgi:hypothetical protein